MLLRALHPFPSLKKLLGKRAPSFLILQIISIHPTQDCLAAQETDGNNTETRDHSSTDCSLLPVWIGSWAAHKWLNWLIWIWSLFFSQAFPLVLMIMTGENGQGPPKRQMGKVEVIHNWNSQETGLDTTTPCSLISSIPDYWAEQPHRQTASLRPPQRSLATSFLLCFCKEISLRLSL